jgi:hypothetical protein
MIQRGYLEHKNFLSMRQEIFSVNHWEYAVSNLSTHFIKSKDKLPNCKRYVRLLGQIEPETKMRVLQLYMARQGLLHTIRFLKQKINQQALADLSTLSLNVCQQDSEMAKNLETRLV